MYFSDDERRSVFHWEHIGVTEADITRAADQRRRDWSCTSQRRDGWSTVRPAAPTYTRRPQHHTQSLNNTLHSSSLITTSKH